MGSDGSSAKPNIVTRNITSCNIPNLIAGHYTPVINMYYYGYWYCGYGSFNNSRRILSPQINTTGYNTLTLSFNYYVDGENYGTDLYDYGTLEYSLNGTTFYNIENYYDKNSITSRTLTLPSVLNNTTFYLAWKFTCDYSIADYPSFAFDNVVLQGTPDCTYPVITSQPSNSTVCSGSNTSFAVVATGTNLTYQWQINQGSGWSNIVNGGFYSNATTPVLNLTGVLSTMNGYLYRCVVSSGSCNTNSNSALLTVQTLPSQPSAITGLLAPCQGSTIVTYSVTNISGTTYTWTVPTGWAITAGQGTNSITVTVGTNSGTISVIPTNTCGSGTAQTLNVTTTATIPGQPDPISGPTSPCQGVPNTYSVPNVSGVTYTWSAPTGWTIAAGQGTSSVTITSGSSSGNITVTPSNSCGNGPSQTLAVSSTSVPAQPSVITGTASPCQGSSPDYSVTNVSGVTYTWTIPAGWTINSGQNSNQINVTVGATAGNITVTPSNVCGNGTARSLAVTVLNIPSQPSTITGSSSPCQGASVNYSVTNVLGVSYTWTFPSGWNQTGGGNTNAVTVTVGTAAGDITVTPSNACGSGTPRTLAVTTTTVPAQPSAINGQTTPCVGSSQNYNVVNVSGVTYTWTFPTGWTKTAGGTTNSVTVTVASASGNITVTPSNGCGNGTAQTLAVTTVTVPAQPSAITGNTTACSGSSQTYSITNVADVNYTWTVPSGWTITAGQGTNQVTVTVGSTSGNISVTPSNVCGNGTIRSLWITVAYVPAQPSTISGPTSPCQGTSQNYSVTNVSGVTYSWIVPADWTINSGQGVNQINVTVGAATGNISVTPSNGCGNGTVRSLAVTTTAVPGQPSAITGETYPLCIGTSRVYSVTNVPGVIYTWTFPSGWIQTGGGTSNSVTVTIGSGSGNITVTPSNGCGNGTPSILAVSPMTVPDQPAEITGNNNPCTTFMQTYTVTNVPGVNYTWTVPADWTISSGQGTSSVNLVVGALSGQITVTPSNVCGNGTSRTLNVTVKFPPAQPGPIQPNLSIVCQGSIQNYTASPSAGATSYTWNGPPGSTILSGQGTNIISIQFGSTSGDLTITPSNICGNGPSQSMAITVVNSTPSQPSAISGKVAPCIGASEIYSVTNIAGLVYNWAVPSGWTITIGQGTNSMTVTVGPTAGNITVVAVNACGASQQRSIAVTPQSAAPLQPDPITGNTPVCFGSTQIYSVTAIPFVNYTWTYPADWTLVSGQGTASVTFTTGASSGTLSVTPSNSCGNGPSASKTVVVDPAAPLATSAIAGDNTPCEASTQTYSVTQVNGVTYTWSIPGNWTMVCGQGTSSIQVNIGTLSGNVQVIPSNSCGNGPVTTLSTTIDPLPPAAGAITGGASVCEASAQTYSVTDLGATYNWSVPANWTITSGQGTHQITVTIGNTSGNVIVTPHNICGDGVTGTLPVTVNLLPAAFTGPNGAICTGDDIQIGGPPVGSNTYSWISVPAGFASTDSDPTVEPAVPTYYTLTETTPAGCVRTNTVYIEANQIIQVYLDPPSQTICTGGTTNILVTSNILEVVITWTVTGSSFITGQADGGGSTISQTLVNTSDVAGQVTYWLTLTADKCENKEESVVVTVNPAPVASSATSTRCSDVAIGVTLPASNNAVAIANYNILSINSNGLTASAGNPATGNGFSSAEIADDAWTNTGFTPINVIYTIVPVSALGCQGSPFTVTVTIDPEPIITNLPAKNICSGTGSDISLAATIPSSFSWTIGTVTGGITGASNGSGTSINQVLTNPSNASPGTVEYIITPVSSPGGCTGSSFTITITVYPIPQMTSNPAARICSGQTTSIPLTATTPSSFAWTVGTITGGITGASGGSGNSISQALINPSNATAGTVQYMVTATSSDGNCQGSAYSILVTVDPIPTVTAGASDYDVCPGTPFNLSSTSSLIFYPTTLLSEGFNAPTNNWTKINNSTGGISPDSAAWKLRPDGYVHYGQTFHSNDNSRFYLTSSYAQGYEWYLPTPYTYTYLVSPSISTVGYSSLTLDFYHYYNDNDASAARVQVSIDGTNWTTIATYTSDIGSSYNFIHQVINLNPSYTGLPQFFIRFYYYGSYDRYWAIDNVTIKGTVSAPMPIISWTSNTSGWTSSESNPPNVSQTETSTYTVTYTNPISFCSASTSVIIATLPLPAASITADYCAQPGCVQLTASGGGTYLWNTTPPSTNQTICVDEAGIYSVAVTGGNGCTAPAFLSVANELVTNGTFDAGNSGFTTNYGYVADIPGVQDELWPEGLYSVGYDAYNYHTNFYGKDRTNAGTGQFMIVNGLGSSLVIWQQTVPVYPNTNYYFSAWAMSTNDEGNYARLRFEVNGVQVGTIAELGPGPANNSQVDPSDWIRFYSNPTWNSGTATTAVIRIINLRPDLGGNDFGLDDISFGTLDPIPFVASPAGNITDTVCEFGTLYFDANISGGLPPYYFNWSGPNGFSSTLQDPVIQNVTPAAQGVYTVSISDGYGCAPQTFSFPITVNPAPTATLTGGGDYCQFGPSPFIYFNGADGTPPYTFEYTINGGPTQILSTWGTESTAFIFASTMTIGTYVYNLTSVQDANGCIRDMNTSTTVTIHELPICYIDGNTTVCPAETYLSYSGPPLIAGYLWSISGGGTIDGVNDQMVVNIIPYADCDTYFTLSLVSSSEYGCQSSTQLLVHVVDDEAPVITTTAINQDLGCNPDITPPSFTGTDNCEGLIVPVVATGGIISNGCSYSQTWDADYTDACGNTASKVSITYTWIQDLLAPTAGNLPDVVLPNWDDPFPDPDPTIITDEWDNCGTPIVAYVGDGPPDGNNCIMTIIRSYSLTDGCGNNTIVTQNLIRMLDDGTWWGTTDDWNTASNWCFGVPISTTNVKIPAGTPQKPRIFTGQSGICNSINIHSGTTLTIDGTFDANTVIINGGITLNSDGTNYGSMKIGNFPVGGTGKVTYNLYMQGDNHIMFSSPVKESVSTFESTNDAVIREWDEPSGSWTISADTGFIPGKGYAWYTNDPDAGTRAFQGVPTTMPLQRTTTAPFWQPDTNHLTGRNWGGGGWNLLGNPFTCALNVSGAGTNFIETNLSKFFPEYAAIYLYEDGWSWPYIGLNTGDFHSGATYHQAIQVGQGFLLLTYGEGVVFDITPDMQIHETDIPLIKSAQKDNEWFGLNLSVTNGTQENYTTIVYNKSMTAGLDPGYDVGQLSGWPEVEIYTALVAGSEVNFARQALPLADYENNVVSVGIDSENGGEVTFSAWIIPIEEHKFLLEDRLTNEFTDLHTGTYTVTLPPHTYGTGRFYIHAVPPTGITEKHPVSDPGQLHLRIWSFDKWVYIEGELSNRATATLYDLLGRKIMDIRLTGEKLNTFSMPSSAKGIYLLQCVDGQKTSTHRLIF